MSVPPSFVSPSPHGMLLSFLGVLVLLFSVFLRLVSRQTEDKFIPISGTCLFMRVISRNDDLSLFHLRRDISARGHCSWISLSSRSRAGYEQGCWVGLDETLQGSYSTFSCSTETIAKQIILPHSYEFTKFLVMSRPRPDPGSFFLSFR